MEGDSKDLSVRIGKVLKYAGEELLKSGGDLASIKRLAAVVCVYMDELSHLASCKIVSAAEIDKDLKDCITKEYMRATAKPWAKPPSDEYKRIALHNAAYKETKGRNLLITSDELNKLVDSLLDKV